MDNLLDAFLSADLNVEDEVYIKRFDAHVRIKAVLEETLNSLRERATYYLGKGNKRRKEFNEEQFVGLLIAEACLNIDFGDPKMLEKYKATDAADCVTKALLAGEVSKIRDAIFEISGFTDDDQEAVEEIKN
ncbi:phage tail assembly chaperone [Heyndrickxia oleronia]|uniref:Uncharacterized protein n=1 Tax=Heyndrickxia oleronia TaxID=38875 RepID=A0AAW6SM54_9BACI|nr:hypothetical protein [Heyndrickxia oleronia]MDH5159819.1 hypothetical protein [Heyndrickxia oleronia]